MGRGRNMALQAASLEKELGLEEWPGCEVCASLDLQQ